MQNKRKLEQAKIRFEKAANPDPTPKPSSTTEKKRLTRQAGSLHEKYLCIWCKKPDKRKHSGDTLSVIQSWTAWNSFKNHTIYLKDEDLRRRILALIATTTDPFAT